MRSDIASITGDRYDKLPECIKSLYTREQFKWLSDTEKSRLVESETTPEWTEP